MSREDLPHIQLYPGDWFKDVAVQSLSHHYKGIWVEILMFMHNSEDRGRLVANSKPVTAGALGRLLGIGERDAEQAIQVLVGSGTASRDENGALICRRMVREERERRCNAERVHRYREKKRQCNGDVTPNDIDIGNDLKGRRKKEEGRDRAGNLGEVIAFCHEIGLPRSDAEWFWHKCEGNGWTNGGKRILDWRQVLRSWKAGGYVPSISNPRKGVPPPAEKREIKPQPDGWKEWLAEHYPDATQKDYWRAPGDVQREFKSKS